MTTDIASIADPGFGVAFAGYFGRIRQVATVVLLCPSEVFDSVTLLLTVSSEAELLQVPFCFRQFL